MTILCTLILLCADTLLGPVVLLEPERGPRVALRRLSEPPLVAIRLAVPVDEAPGAAGATRVLQMLLRARLDDEAARYGARVELARTPTHAVYSVAGPVRAFDALVALLRRAIAFPAVSARELDAARVTVQSQALSELETPAPYIRRRLAESLFSRYPPSAVSGTELAALTPERLRLFWAEQFRPERMQAVVVGDLTAGEVQSAFRDWPAPERAESFAAPETGTPPAADREVLAPWAALGYAVSDHDPATLLVAARLIEDRLEQDPALRHARAEVWWSGAETALVLIAGSPTETTSSAAAVATRLRAAVAETLPLLTPGAVADARAAAQRELLLAARTPQGLVRLIGEFWERTGEAEGAEAFTRALAGLTIDSVAGALLGMLERTPVLIEVQP